MADYDPDAALADMLDIARSDQSEFHDGIHRLAQHVLDLNAHIEAGGSLPAAWQATVGAGTIAGCDANGEPTEPTAPGFLSARAQRAAGIWQK